MTYLPEPSASPMQTHQKVAFEATRDALVHALFWEQRTRKTRVIIDTAAYNYERDIIGSVIVVAMPSGVTANWVEEIEKYLPHRIPRSVLRWRAKLAKTKFFEAEAEALLKSPNLAWLLVNGEALITDSFRRYARKFLQRGKILAIGDETSEICPEPGAARSKVMHALGRNPNVVMKRILDGTPGLQSPFDFYSQMKFLDPAIIGQPTFASFKAHYAKWERRTNHKTGYDYDALIEYQNLDELRELMSPHSSRVLRSQVFDSPEKEYEFIRYDLSDEQERVYSQLSATYKAELATGDRVTAAMALTRYLRLQQVLSNFWPSERLGTKCVKCTGAGCDVCGSTGIIVIETEHKIVDPKHHPRLEVLGRALSRGNPCIVWSRFDKDVEDVLALATRLGIPAARYDGKTKDVDKSAAVSDFAAGRIDLISAKAKSAGRGLPFYRARDLFFYSNTFSMKDRAQAEDRAEGPGKSKSTVIIDIRAEDTIDDVITTAYQTAQSVSNYVMKEKQGRWL